MARTNVAEHLICWPSLGCPLTDAFQTAAHLGSPRLLNALFGRLQALQKSLRQVRTVGLGKRERLVCNLLDGRGHERTIAFGVRLVKNAESASESPNVR